MKLTRYAKFSWFVLFWNLLVILWGALVRASGSGAGCGSHWPTCNGAIILQPQTIQTVIEFTHRMMSGAALILVLILLIGAFRWLPKGHLARKSAVGAAAFILIEALLGAGLVLFKLVEDNSSAARAAAVAIHLLNTFILVGWLTLTAWWASGGKSITLKNKGWWPLLIAAGLTGVALIGTSGAITALGDTLFPSTSIAHSLEQMSDPQANFLINLRVIHPIIAILVGLLGLYLARAAHNTFNTPLIRRLSLLFSGLIFVQWTAGVTNILLLAPAWMQLVHLFLADTVLIALVLLSANILTVQE
ncbi:MAG: cytochrome oxidase assembly protein [Anaerolineae bacterium CG_4_9_14_3_um_filter_57_17]|nr:heme A synthase [bacterium]OIO84290.1 MAG: hypothetical protein AUK01_09890 [Anaerolineae bacterium CG2_30_57_67]PJB65570.1 MAG: cytochrome oxidase assembly protein [Anaerolineae bacterium CG_4_9_14_3_um_filter_57_17]